MTSTALILRPADAPDIRVLECDGPFDIAPVNHFPRAHIKGNYLTFDEWKALPAHVKNLPDAPDELDASSAIRIAALLENFERTKRISFRQIRELRWRFELLHPWTSESDVRTEPLSA
jgi:hypothetical protein